MTEANAIRPQRPVVGMRGLTVRFGDLTAVNKVTVEITGPQVVGILGANGAGKTTLLACLEGLRVPDEGTIRLFGEEIRGLDRYPRSRVGAVLQHESVFERITVGEYAELFTALYGAPRARAAALLDEAGLAGRTNTPVEKLSGGESQRLFIAAAVVHEPDLLFLDEPTAHLDPGTRQRIGAALRAMGTRRTVIVTTHDLAEADAVCDTLLFLHEGSARAFGPKAQLLADVPAAARAGAPGEAATIQDAFFHYCGSQLDKHGDLS